MRLGSIRSLMGLGLLLCCVLLGIWAIDWPRTLDELSRVRAGWVCFGILAACLSFAGFALRWRALMPNLPLFPFRHAFGYLMIGYMVNAVLPMRPGDVLRAALISGRYDVTLAGALSSIVLERLMDVLTIVVMGSLIALIVELPQPLKIGLLTFAGAGILGLAIIISLSMRTTATAMITSKLGAGRYTKRVFAQLHPFVEGLTALRRMRNLRRALFWDAFAWSAYALYIGCMLLALQVPVPPIAGLVVVVAVSLGAAIPSSPGAIGVYHAIAILALSGWGVSPPTAVGFALVSHAIAISLHIALGAASASAMGVHSVFRLARETDK